MIERLQRLKEFWSTLRLKELGEHWNAAVGQVNFQLAQDVCSSWTEPAAQEMLAAVCRSMLELST
eukprot:982082-Amphidinium_carterae.1